MYGRQFVITCLLVVALSAFSMAQNVASNSLQLASGSPVTVQTTFELLDASLEGVWLSALKQNADDEAAALGLVWSEDTSGWFPVWGLHVAGSAQLMGEQSRAKAGSGFLADVSFTTVHAVTPQAGHVYEAVLSYDPQTGRAAVGLTDVTTGTRIVGKDVRLQPYSGVLYETVDAGTAPDAVAVQSVNVSSYAVPLGTEWDLVAKEAGQYKRLLDPRLTPSRDLAVRLNAKPIDDDGEFVFHVDGETQSVTAFRQQSSAVGADTIVPVAVDRLPLGRLSGRLDYVDPNGKAWNLGSRDMHVVAANLDISFSELRLADDGVLHGQVNIRSTDDIVSDLPYRLSANVGTPDKQGEDVRLDTAGVLPRVTYVPTAVPFEIPLKADDRLFSITMDIGFDIPVGKLIETNTYHVLLKRKQ